MNFSSLKEYFYKQYNACLSRMLVSMGVFLLIYYLSLSEMVSPYIQAEELIDFLRFTYLALILITLTIVHLEIYRRLRAHAMVVGLGQKLDLYFTIVRMRMRTFLIVSLFLATGFFFTGHPWFSIYFACMLGWFLLQWPTPRSVCRQLKLRGDERAMVMTKGEAFKF